MHAGAKIAVFCFVFHDNKLLLIKRGKAPYIDMVTIPGGHKEKSESLREACKREFVEETGLLLAKMKFVGLAHSNSSTPEYISVYYMTSCFTGQLRSSPEGEVFWGDVSEILQAAYAVGEDMKNELERPYHPALLAILPKVMLGMVPFEAALSKSPTGESICTMLE